MKIKSQHKAFCKNRNCICRAKAFDACPHCSGIEAVRLKIRYIKALDGKKIRVLICPKCNYKG